MRHEIITKKLKRGKYEITRKTDGKVFTAERGTSGWWLNGLPGRKSLSSIQYDIICAFPGITAIETK